MTRQPGGDEGEATTAARRDRGADDGEEDGEEDGEATTATHPSLSTVMRPVQLPRDDSTAE